MTTDRGEVAENDESGVPAFDEGRYLYCIVRADEDESFETSGVDGEPVSLVVYDDVAAVVHACDDIYDSADLGAIKRWLVRHQLVVDEASDLGTPIPFQFDTILRGDDEAVREWLREEYGTLDHALSELASHWEYRVEVVETDPADLETLRERDDQLRELDERIRDATAGTAHLLEKQAERRAKEVRTARRESITDDLRRRLETVVREVHVLDRSPSASLSEEVGGGSGGTDDGETVCRLTLLAHEDREESVGSILDDVASSDGIEVRFTGPWPPYTFAPTLGETVEEEKTAGEGDR